MGTRHRGMSRREVCVLVPLLSSAIVGADPQRGPAHISTPLDEDWLFGGKYTNDAVEPQFDDKAFSRITLPHCVSRLSWQDWDPASWQGVWIYRRHFARPRDFKNRRVFLEFEGVMTGASPVINGHALAPHVGGYLPFRYEITDWLSDGDNVLAVAVDSRWKNVPPEGSPDGPRSIDYLEPGGILRPVRLRAVPQIFISDVFAMEIC